MLRIGVNSLQIQRGRALSVGIYLRHLLDGLGQSDPDAEYVVFASPGTAGTFAAGKRNFREVVCPWTHLGRPIRILYEQFALPILLRRLGIDVLFSPENSAPLVLPCRSVLGVQMMMMYTTPECFPGLLRRSYFRRVMRRAAHRADRIVCVSESIRREVTRYLQVPREKTVVIPEAPAAYFRPMGPERSREVVVRKYGLGGRYFLCVAIMAPYKNLHRLVDAFAKVCQHPGVDHDLVLAGGEDAWPGYRESVARRVDELGLNSRVRFLGSVEHTELPALYSAADALVFPSLCESFGLPVVEAMACGCPVITSNYTCLPETAGGAALLVDPFSVESIAVGMRDVALSADLREDLRSAGLARAARLSWAESGRALAKVFRDVCSAGCG